MTKKAIVAAVAIAAAFLFYRGFTLASDYLVTEWQLVACEDGSAYEENCNGDYIRIDGFKDLGSCFIAGDKLNKNGFECGKNCELSTTGTISICEETVDG